MSVDSKKSETQALYPGAGVVTAWALALGTSIGWGSLVVTCNTYLAQAGPAGSILGMLAGAVMMLIISRNYHYMINCFPDAGGVYTYCKESFGYDYGFLAAWFLGLTYAAVFWANVTSLPLFARYFIGDVFRFGKLYTLFGYQVYLGEALLSVGAILLTLLLCSRRKASFGLLKGLVILFTVGITVCFIAAMLKSSAAGHHFQPAFIPDKNAVSQIIKIACISPWAFIGFENISHLTEEFSFPRSRVFRILAVAVGATTALYIFVMLLSVSAYPPEYASWLDYIRDLNHLEGIKGLPAFYAASCYMGYTGVYILMAVLLALVITSLIGNTVALSRLVFALGRDDVLPETFAVLNKDRVPVRAILLVAAISLPIPFLGRTAIGWIVDVTTIGATLIYGLVSACTFRIAKLRGDRSEYGSGLIGLILMAILMAVLLLPNLFAQGSMEKESYFLFIVWAILGFVLFRLILYRDTSRRFGHSIVVWIALLSLVLLIALIWMNQSMMSYTNRAMSRIHEYYLAEHTLTEHMLQDEAFIREQMAELSRANSRTMLTVAGLFIFSLVVLTTNYTYMSRKTREKEIALGHVQDIAFRDPLTGVKSKNAYVAKEKELNEQIAEGTAEAFAVVVCDVNGLKHINDTYGHKAGDEHICAAARLICEIFQHSPVYRVGGDEFTVLLSGRDHENRGALMEELCQRAEANIASGSVVVAGGLSDYMPGVDLQLHTVFERADILMYRRKQELKALGAKTR